MPRCGIPGSRISLDFEDGACDPTQAAAAVKFMARDGVKSVAPADDNTSYAKDIAIETKKDLQAVGTVKVALATSVTSGKATTPRWSTTSWAPTRTGSTGPATTRKAG